MYRSVSKEWGEDYWTQRGRTFVPPASWQPSGSPKLINAGSPCSLPRRDDGKNSPGGGSERRTWLGAVLRSRWGLPTSGLTPSVDKGTSAWAGGWWAHCGENPGVLGALLSRAWPTFAHCGVGERAFFYQSSDCFLTKIQFLNWISTNMGSIHNQIGLFMDYKFIHSFIRHLLIPCSVPGAGHAEMRHSLPGLSGASQHRQLPGHTQVLTLQYAFRWRWASACRPTSVQPTQSRLLGNTDDPHVLVS